MSKHVLSAPNGSQFFGGSSVPDISFVEYSASLLSVDVLCTGTNLASAYELASYSDMELNAPSTFDMHVTAKYIDASNRCIILPNRLGNEKPHRISVFAYIQAALPSPIPDVTVFLPMIQGMQSTFYDGSNSINLPIGRSMTFSQLGINFTSGGVLWTRS